ncbi:hypothetical protein L208DRAFT_1240824 [Tricholoma matsutake]|nr:hypothetical protein L208DRAFT_1240824 [Tricholoma matsutake 945]
MRSSSRYTLSPDPQTSSTSALPLLSDEEEESQGPLSTSAASHTNADSIRATYGSELEVHHDDVIEHLDVIDPQVSTISNLANAANTILIPPLSWYSRKPIVELTPIPSADPIDAEAGIAKDPHYEHTLDRHVDDVLRRPSKLRRTMKGVWSFLKTREPLIITAIYGFLVVFWGAAIVFFVAKIINLHNKNLQGIWVEISSQVENGLFTITGVGLIPSRVLATYRIYWIWHYKRKTNKLRAQAGLEPLVNVDELPDPALDPNYRHVLTEEEQNHLSKLQSKFQHSQTWYRPHRTDTHRAFSINTALLICLLTDGNSIFQVMLCGTMWGLNRFQRPAWTTATLITFSFLCGIFAAVFIWLGGKKTKLVEEVEERLREALQGSNQISQDGSSVPNAEKKMEDPTVEKKMEDPVPVVEEIMMVPPVKHRPSAASLSRK